MPRARKPAPAPAQRGACRFTISSTNPNNAVGGGGCACSPLAHPDQEGPYAIFFASETDSNLSPHLVVCAPCAGAIVAKAHDGDVLQAGEDDDPNEEELAL